MEKKYEISFDVLTGETSTRELTPDEIAELPQATNETPFGS
jgi:hypothetical protein